jgi:hypothetical protein
MKLPMKTRILERIIQKKNIWEDVLIKDILSEYNQNLTSMNIGKIRYSLAELYAGGLIQQLDIKEDTEKFAGDEKLLHSYAPTSSGLRRAKEVNLKLEE